MNTAEGKAQINFYLLIVWWLVSKWEPEWTWGVTNINKSNNLKMKHNIIKGGSAVIEEFRSNDHWTLKFKFILNFDDNEYKN